MIFTYEVTTIVNIEADSEQEADSFIHDEAVSNVQQYSYTAELVEEN